MREADGGRGDQVVVTMMLMRLSHTAPNRYAVLTPAVGGSRHGGEDARAVGKAVVWLANEDMVRTESDGTVQHVYLHEVEIDEDDPDLFLDEPFAQLMADGAAIFGNKSTLRWYFCTRRTRPLDVIAVRVFDPTTHKFV